MELENYKTSDVIGYIVNSVANERGIKKELAKKLVLNALTYNIVIEEINNQIDFLLGE